MNTGSRRIGNSGRPRSPVKASPASCDPSFRRSATDAEPRICPASSSGMSPRQPPRTAWNSRPTESAGMWRRRPPACRAGPPGAVLLSVALVDELGVLLLDVRGVAQHHVAEALCRGRAVDGAAESLAHQRGQIAAVIDVGVGEHDRVDRGGVEGEGAVADPRLVSPSVKDAAIKENGLARRPSPRAWTR